MPINAEQEAATKAFLQSVAPGTPGSPAGINIPTPVDPGAGPPVPPAFFNIVRALNAPKVKEAETQYRWQAQQFNDKYTNATSNLNKAVNKGDPTNAEIFGTILKKMGVDRGAVDDQVGAAHRVAENNRAEEANKQRQIRERFTALGLSGGEAPGAATGQTPTVRQPGTTPAPLTGLSALVAQKDSDIKYTVEQNFVTGAVSLKMAPPPPKTLNNLDTEFLQDLARTDPAAHKTVMGLRNLYPGAKFATRVDENSGISWSVVQLPNGTEYMVGVPQKLQLDPEQRALQAGQVAKQKALGEEDAARQIFGQPPVGAVSSGIAPDAVPPPDTTTPIPGVPTPTPTAADPALSGLPSPIQREIAAGKAKRQHLPKQMGIETVKGLGLIDVYQGITGDIEKTLGLLKPLSELTDRELALVDTPANPFEWLLIYADKYGVFPSAQRIRMRTSVSKLPGLLYAMHGKQLSDKELEVALGMIPLMEASDLDFIIKLQEFARYSDDIVKKQIRAFGKAGFDVNAFEQLTPDQRETTRHRRDMIFEKLGYDPTDYGGKPATPIADFANELLNEMGGE